MIHEREKKKRQYEEGEVVLIFSNSYSYNSRVLTLLSCKSTQLFPIGVIPELNFPNDGAIPKFILTWLPTKVSQ
jgi:hypothetical protein